MLVATPSTAADTALEVAALVRRLVLSACATKRHGSRQERSRKVGDDDSWSLAYLGLGQNAANLQICLHSFLLRPSVVSPGPFSRPGIAALLRSRK